MCSNTSYTVCRQTDLCDDSQTMATNDGTEQQQQHQQQQNLISRSSTIPEQLECHIPAIPSPNIYHRCATRSRIALAVICAVLLTFVIFTITAARAKSSLKYGPNGLIDNYGHQSMAEQQALGLSLESVVVDTGCGKLIGDEEHEAFVFKGIPYAVPPTGTRRWSVPQPLTNETVNCSPDSQRHATKFGSPCFQVNPYTKQIEGNEDCLYLNVWTPNIDPEVSLPVMVWIHGGFLQFGSGHQPGLRPSGKLAKTMNKVYISLNYRLFAFGFMTLDLMVNNSNNGTADSLPKNDINSTNYGLMDVILALNWIQDNVKAFGGDPKKVTLFGADSGAAIILAIISNQNLKNLYANSWLINPALYLNHTFAEVSTHNRKNFLKHSGCKTIECLRSLSSTQVVEYFLGKNDPSFRINDQNDLPILGIMSEQLIIIDDQLVRDSYPFDSSVIDSPVLIGSTAQAIEFWPGPRDLDSWNWRDYTKYVTTSLDSFSAHISRKSLQLYAPIEDGNETTPAIQYINMVSDLRQVCPNDFLAENLAKKSDNTSIYRYHFNARLSEPVHVYGYPSIYSFHLIDIISYFDEIQSFIRHPTDEDYSIRDSIQRLVQSFVNNSDINQNSLNNTKDNVNDRTANTTATTITVTNMTSILNTSDSTSTTVTLNSSTNTTTVLTDYSSGSTLSTSIPVVPMGQPFPKQFIEIVSDISINRTLLLIKNYTQSDRCLFWQTNQLFEYVWTV